MRFVGIDPSTKTGFVALTETGQVERAKELTGIGKQDPKRLVTLIHDVVEHLKPQDIICIEGFPFATQRAMFAGGIHHGIRNEFFKRKLKYYEVSPAALKKFVGVTGWTGQPGSKERLKGKEKKKAVMAALEAHFGVKYSNDNIADAYILARIAKELFFEKNRVMTSLPEYQAEVVNSILYPPEKKRKKVAK